MRFECFRPPSSFQSSTVLPPSLPKSLPTVVPFPVQAILASHFSRPSKSASPSSPLLPRALHSTNSTFMGSWEKSKSLPFFPSWAGPPVAEPSRLVGAAERVTRKVLLQTEKGKSQELWTRGMLPTPWLPRCFGCSSINRTPATARTEGPRGRRMALPCEAQAGAGTLATSKYPWKTQLQRGSGEHDRQQTT